MSEDKQKMMKECYSCKEKRAVPGNCHIKCNNPDPEMTGNAHGKNNGWFFYPDLFDPVWKTKECSNYVAENAVSNAISDAGSSQ